MVEKTQRQEVRKMRRTEEQAAALRFREAVLSASPDAQRNVAPFLATPVLRNLVRSLTNDEYGDFDRWATNPLVLRMLGEAKKAIEEGRLTETEVERLLVAHAKVRGGEAGAGQSPARGVPLDAPWRPPFAPPLSPLLSTRTRSSTRRAQLLSRRRRSRARGWTRPPWWAR